MYFLNISTIYIMQFEFIINLRQCYVCCIRSGITQPRCTCAAGASMGYIWCFGHTLIYLCVSLLQNLSVSQHFYSPLSIIVSLSLCGAFLLTLYLMVWDYQGSKAVPIPLFDLAACPFFLQFSLSLLSSYGLVLWGWALRTDWV